MIDNFALFCFAFTCLTIIVWVVTKNERDIKIIRLQALIEETRPKDKTCEESVDEAWENFR